MQFLRLAPITFLAFTVTAQASDYSFPAALDRRYGLCVNSFAVSPDNSMVAVYSGLETKLLGFDSGEVLAELPKGKPAFGADGSVIYLFGDTTITSFNVGKEQAAASFDLSTVHPGALINNWYLSQSEGRIILRTDGDSPHFVVLDSELAPLGSHAAPTGVYDADFLPGTDELLLADPDANTILRWNTSNNQEQYVAFTPEGHRAVGVRTLHGEVIIASSTFEELTTCKGSMPPDCDTRKTTEKYYERMSDSVNLYEYSQTLYVDGEPPPGTSTTWISAPFPPMSRGGRYWVIGEGFLFDTNLQTEVSLEGTGVYISLSYLLDDETGLVAWFDPDVEVPTLQHLSLPSFDSTNSLELPPCRPDRPILLGSRLLFQDFQQGGDRRGYLFEDPDHDFKGAMFAENSTEEGTFEDSFGMQPNADSTLLAATVDNHSLATWDASDGSLLSLLHDEGSHEEQSLNWQDRENLFWLTKKYASSTSNSLLLMELHSGAVAAAGLYAPLREVPLQVPNRYTGNPTWNASSTELFVAGADNINLSSSMMYRYAADGTTLLDSGLVTDFYVRTLGFHLSENTSRIIIHNAILGPCYIADWNDLSSVELFAPNGSETIVFSPGETVVAVGHIDQKNWFFDLSERKFLLELTNCKPIELITPDGRLFHGGDERYKLDYPELKRRWARERLLGMGFESASYLDLNSDGTIDVGDYEH